VTSSRERIDARRAIQERASSRRREREQKELRIAELAVTVSVALDQGRRAVSRAEQEAGSALAQMIDIEGLAVTEAIDWIGEPMLSARDVSRLRAVAGTSRDPAGGRSQ
jgi:hypothetical protein